MSKRDTTLGLRVEQEERARTLKPFCMLFIKRWPAARPADPRSLWPGQLLLPRCGHSLRGTALPRSDAFHYPEAFLMSFLFVDCFRP